MANGHGGGKIQLPSGQGGLIRYFDDYKSKVEINAHYFVAFVALVIVVYTFIYFF